MKKTHLLIVINLFITLGAFSYFYFSADRKMAYVDSNLLLSQYQGMTDARTQYGQMSMQWKAQIDTLTLEVQDELKRHERELAKMTKKEKTLSEQLIRNKQQQLITFQQSIQEKAAQEDSKITQAVINEVNAYLEEFGKKHDYKIIFAATDAGNILYATDAINITEKVVEGLNKRYKGE